MGQEFEKLDILQDLIFFVKITDIQQDLLFVGETISYLYLILIFHAWTIVYMTVLVFRQ